MRQSIVVLSSVVLLSGCSCSDDSYDLSEAEEVTAAAEAVAEAAAEDVEESLDAIDAARGYSEGEVSENGEIVSDILNDTEQSIQEDLRELR